MKLTRREFLLTLAALGAGAGAGYVRLGEPNRLRVTRKTVPLPGRDGADPLRILHLSDLHVHSRTSLARAERAVELGLRENPDLICLTGDYVTGRLRDASPCARLLERLPGAAPTLACLGNHDGGAWSGPRGGYEDVSFVSRMVTDCGIRLLRNESAQVEVKGTAVEIIGFGDLWAAQMDAAAAFAPAADTRGALRLLLVHNPDGKDAVRPYDWDLMLSGHTHGGQLVLPLLGTPFAPVVDQRFVSGLHRWEDRWIHVTRGVGNLHELRFNCPPEVSVLEVAGRRQASGVRGAEGRKDPASLRYAEASRGDGWPTTEPPSRRARAGPRA